MTAIAKTALSRVILDISESTTKTGLERTDFQLAHARCVDDPYAPLHLNKMTRSSCVTALRIVLANFGRSLHLPAQQRVDEGGFADARRANECDRLPDSKPGA